MNNKRSQVRVLDEYEEKQLKISQLYHQNRLEKRIIDKGIIQLIVFGIILGCLTYYFASQILGTITVIIFMVIWIIISDFKKNKKYSKEILELINKVKEDKGIRTTIYECNKIIQFGDLHDTMAYFAFEISDNQLLFILVYEDSYDSVLSTKIEILEDEGLGAFLGFRFKSKGEFLQPIVIDIDVTRYLFKSLIPSDNTIIKTSALEFLERIETKLKNES